MQYGEEMLTLVTKERDTLANQVRQPQFICFTSTQVQILTQKKARHTYQSGPPTPHYIHWHKSTNIDAFIGTNVQILTHLADL
jgi:hypothetical protein